MEIKKCPPESHIYSLRVFEVNINDIPYSPLKIYFSSDGYYYFIIEKRITVYT